MRTLFILLACFFTMNSALYADNDKSIQVNQLPAKAQQFINSHFTGNKLALAKMETGFLDKSYDVIFTNGNKVEFDKKGEWTEVNCKYSTVPVNIIPGQIRKYVTEHYPAAKVIKIDRNKKEYEVKLSDGWELKFDSKFRIIDIDN